MTKRFNDYTDAELLTLDNETINDAIRIEAIQQGIQPPVTLSEALRKSEWRGYQKPAENVAVYELVLTGKYASEKSTGVAYLDKAKAEAALDGVVYVENETYGNNPGWKIVEGNACVSQRWIGVSKSEQAWAKLEEFKQDATAFNTASDACVARLSTVRQADYDKRVNAEKKAEYLRLAGGDEEIAKNFWAKAERTGWPI